MESAALRHFLNRGRVRISVRDGVRAFSLSGPILEIGEDFMLIKDDRDGRLHAIRLEAVILVEEPYTGPRGGRR